MDINQVLDESTQPQADEQQAAPAQEETQVESPAVEAPVAEQPRDELGRFAHKQTGETNDAAAEQKVPVSALIAERTKRQALEAQLNQRQAPSFWEDPEQAVNLIKEETQRHTEARRLDMSEYMARQTHPDYEEKFAAFAQLIQKPGMQHLQVEALSHPHPAEFVYQTAKNYLDFQQVGSLDKAREKWEAENRERIRVEERRKLEEEQKRAASLPQTLSDVNGASAGGALRDPSWNGPTPLGSFLANR